MLCAEDEQSRTCWMTAFRLLKVHPLLPHVNLNECVCTGRRQLMPSLLSCVLTVWDSAVPELQRSPAEEV